MTKRGNNMIKVDNLSYSFPQKDLYNNISFTIEEGQHCAFIGASGSGKSTLIDIIMYQTRRRNSTHLCTNGNVFRY